MYPKTSARSGLSKHALAAAQPLPLRLERLVRLLVSFLKIVALGRLSEKSDRFLVLLRVLLGCCFILKNQLNKVRIVGKS